MILSGVLYIHNIAQQRSDVVSSKMNLEMFESLVGIGRKEALPAIALVSTHWDVIREDVGRRREEELKKTFWKDAIKHGASVHRAHGESTPRTIIEHILSLSMNRAGEETSMLIQEELVDKEIPILLTEAGQRLQYDRDTLLEHQAQIARNSKDNERRANTEKKLELTKSQRRSLNVSFKDRVSTWARSVRPGC
jgi:hypothetical protein